MPISLRRVQSLFQRGRFKIRVSASEKQVFSLSLALVAMERCHSTCRAPPARNVFFRDDNYERTFCLFVLSPSFLLFTGHCAPLEPHCLERNAFVARLAVLDEEGERERECYIQDDSEIYLDRGGGNIKKQVVQEVSYEHDVLLLNFLSYE